MGNAPGTLPERSLNASGIFRSAPGAFPERYLSAPGALSQCSRSHPGTLPERSRNSGLGLLIWLRSLRYCVGSVASAERAPRARARFARPFLNNNLLFGSGLGLLIWLRSLRFCVALRASSWRFAPGIQKISSFWLFVSILVWLSFLCWFCSLGGARSARQGALRAPVFVNNLLFGWARTSDLAS